MTHLRRASVILLCCVAACCEAGPGPRDVLQQSLTLGTARGVAPQVRSERPFHADWAATIESGTFRWWGDGNRDGSVDADEVRKESYSARYRARIWAADPASFSLEDTAGDTGAFVSVLRDFTNWAPPMGTPVSPIPSLGDVSKGWLVRDTAGGGEEGPARHTETLLLTCVRGPYRLFVDVGCEVIINGQLLQPEELAPVYVLDKPQLDTRIKQWRSDRMQVAAELIRNMLAPLDSWCRARLVRGPGFKGLFPYGLLFCYPSPSDLPNGYRSKPELTSIKTPDTSYSVTYAPESRNGAYTVYRVDMHITHFKDADMSDDAWLSVPKNHYSELSKGASALTRTDVDEAHRRQYRDAGSNYDILSFRTANVAVQIKGETQGDTSSAHPLPLTEPIAAFIIAKLYGKSTPPLQAPMELKVAGPTRVWAGGAPLQYEITATRQ